MPEPADRRWAGGRGEGRWAQAGPGAGFPERAAGPCVPPPSQPLCFPCSVMASKKAPARLTGVLCAGCPLPQNPPAF